MPTRDTDADRLRRLAKLVRAMRSVQQRYFKGDRSAECIRLAKDLERRVDKSCDWVLADRRVTRPLFHEPHGDGTAQSVNLGTPASSPAGPTDPNIKES